MLPLIAPAPETIVKLTGSPDVAAAVSFTAAPAAKDVAGAANEIVCDFFATVSVAPGLATVPPEFASTTS